MARRSWLGKLGRWIRATVVPGVSVSGDISWLSSGAETSAGISITADNVFASTAVLACVRVISETVASLPLKLYRNTLVAGKPYREVARDHPLYAILHSSPNSEQTAHEFWEWMQASALVYGTAYAEIQRDRYGQVVALWPLLSERVRVARDKAKQLEYYVRNDDGSETRLKSIQVFKLKSFSSTGLLGLALSKMSPDAIATAMAQQKWVAKFFANNARPSGVLEHPTVIDDDETIERLRTSWESIYRGLDNAHRVAILEEGMKYHEVGVSPEAAQLIEARTFQTLEVCRIFRMPPHMIQELSHATFTNIEHQGIEFVVHTMMPYFERIQQRVWMDLLNPKTERAIMYAKFQVLALLRGDSAARAAFYNSMFQMGAISPDEIRELEEMNPLPDKRGEVHVIPMNMQVISGELPRRPDAANEAQNQIPRNWIPAYAGMTNRSDWIPASAGMTKENEDRAFDALMADVIRRIERAEEREIKKAERKYQPVNDIDGFNEWMKEFIGGHRAYITAQVEPVYRAFDRGDEVESWVDEYLSERFNGGMDSGSSPE